MIVALYILIALVVCGAILYTLHRRDLSANGHTTPDTDTVENPADPADPECCGMHITCEKDSLLASVSTHIDYYDDEELDRFRGRQPDDYTPDEIEEFRNVLLTLLPSDIAGWGRSIQLRSIQLPTPVRDELLLIIAEARANPSLH